MDGPFINGKYSVYAAPGDKVWLNVRDEAGNLFALYLSPEQARQFAIHTLRAAQDVDGKPMRLTAGLASCDVAV